MLRVSRQVLRPGGLTAFFTIHPAPGLSAQARTRAHRSGPVAVATSRAHRELLTLAGFTDIFEQDCTAEFHEVARAWIDQSDEHRDALADALGAPVFEERQTERRSLLGAIEDGLLCRTLFVAVRPDP